MTTFDLDIAQVHPNPDQPRKIFEPTALQELADSITENGLISAITVRPNGDGYMIIAGERRFRACQLAGLSTIRAEITEADDNDAYALSVIENEQRENLTPLETAKSLKVLMDSQKLTQAEVARRIGKTRTWVTQKLRLLDLPEETQALMSDNPISEGHARQLLKLQTAGLSDQITGLAEQAAKEEWPVATLRDEVDLAIAHQSNGSVSRDTLPKERITVSNHTTGQQFILTGENAQAVLGLVDSLLSKVSRDTRAGRQ